MKRKIKTSRKLVTAIAATVSKRTGWETINGGFEEDAAGVSTGLMPEPTVWPFRAAGADAGGAPGRSRASKSSEVVSDGDGANDDVTEPENSRVFKNLFGFILICIKIYGSYYRLDLVECLENQQLVEELVEEEEEQIMLDLFICKFSLHQLWNSMIGD